MKGERRTVSTSSSRRIPYRQQFRSAEKLCERLLQLDTDEYSAHMKVWENRGKSQKQLERLLRDINASMLAIIESQQSHVVEAYPVVDMSASSEHSILRAQAP